VSDVKAPAAPLSNHRVVIMLAVERLSALGIERTSQPPEEISGHVS
jgi:hypothetical protein